MIESLSDSAETAGTNKPITMPYKRWLPWVETAAGLHTLLCLMMFIIGTPILYNTLTTPCETNCLYFLQLNPDEAETLLAAGLTLHFYALYQIAQELLYLVTFSLVGGVIYFKLVRQRTNQAWYGLLVAFALISIGTIQLAETTLAASTQGAGWLLFYELLKAIAYIAFMSFCLLFPNGRFAPRWVRWSLVAVLVWMVIWVAFPLPELDPARTVGTYPSLLMFLFVVGTQIYRYRRVSTAIERLQTKWFVFGFALVLIVVFLWASVFLIFPPSTGLNRLLTNLIGQGVLAVFPVAFAVCIGISVLRYRLWDIDVIINRTLVYGGLTATIIAMYSLVVGGLGTLFRSENNFLISLVATGLIAILFNPVRERFQNGANRLLYGERDAPLDLLARLGEILASADNPSTILPTYAQTIADSLRLPYVCIWLRQSENQFNPIASYGDQPDHLESIPLLYHGQHIGQLAIALRVGQHAFNRADWRLLDQIAHQTAAAVNTVRLTSDLQQSRERIVTTREEERRRLRRDLHDGLGPVLASQGLKLSAARQLLGKKPDAAKVLLGEVISQNEDTVTDVRRLIYNLRPPSLDDLGLVAAVREGCEQFTGSCRYTVSATPDPLPDLSAAVEVAAYRILMEAATNVSKHAHATTCHLTLTAADNTLTLTIQDNGRGLSTNRHAGVGLTSMRERAAELGGTCMVETAAGGGTIVKAQLPMLTN